MKRYWLIVFSVVWVCVSAGCKSLHSDLDQAVFDQRVHQRFSVGMSISETEAQIKKLSLDYHIGDDKIVGYVYPQWSPVPGVNSFWDTYGRHLLSFHFKDDDGLYEVVYEPKHDVQHLIPLYESEVTP